MPGPRLLAGRYAYTTRIRGTERTIIWLAHDRLTGGSVIASVLPGPRAAALEAAVDVEHPHAATVIAVIDSVTPEEMPDVGPMEPDARVVVAEWFDGASLQQRLDASPAAPEQAVEWIADVLDALAVLHERAAVHGAISPRSIVVARADRGTVPVLAHLVVPPSGVYCSPERVTGGGPSESDDVWAVAATLYTALSRRPPFRGATRTELARAIVAGAPKPIAHLDSELWGVLERALSSDRRSRLRSAAEFRDLLRSWLDRSGVPSLGDFAPVEAIPGQNEPLPNVGDLSLVAALARPDSAEATALLSVHPAFSQSYRPQRSEPPVAPSPESSPISGPSAPSSPPRPVVTDQAGPRSSKRPPQRRRSRVTSGALLGFAAAAAAVAGLLIGRWHASSGRGAEPSRPAPAAAASLTPPTDAQGVLPPGGTSSTTVPGAVPSVAGSTGKELNACVDETFEMFRPTANLGFLCKETDLWGSTRRMDLEVGKHAEGEGLVTWAHLGRFDLAATAILRERCCPDAPDFTAATPKGVCETLSPSLHELARHPSAETTDAYAASVDCLLGRKVRYPAEWWDRVGAKASRTYFDTFLSRAVRAK